MHKPPPAGTLRLLESLNRRVDAGNTVPVIKHPLDAILCADGLIDLGPEGGNNGGRVIAAGTPEHSYTYTGQFLRQVLPG